MARYPATDPLECLDFRAVCTLDGRHGRIEVAVMAGDDDQIDRITVGGGDNRQRAENVDALFARFHLRLQRWARASAVALLHHAITQRAVSHRDKRVGLPFARVCCTIR